MPYRHTLLVTFSDFCSRRSAPLPSAKILLSLKALKDLVWLFFFEEFLLVPASFAVSHQQLPDSSLHLELLQPTWGLGKGDSPALWVESVLRMRGRWVKWPRALGWDVPAAIIFSLHHLTLPRRSALSSHQIAWRITQVTRAKPPPWMQRGKNFIQGLLAPAQPCPAWLQWNPCLGMGFGRRSDLGAVSSRVLWPSSSSTLKHTLNFQHIYSHWRHWGCLHA